MTPNEYQKEALRTASGMSKEYPRILNGLMGLNGEAGECIDILKSIFTRATLSIANTWQKNLAMSHGIWPSVQKLSAMIWRRSSR